MLNVENIVYNAGKTQILNGVSIHVSEGEFVGVLGPNGSGKSTLIKNICKLAHPTGGSVMLCGKDLLTMKNRDMARLLSVVSQEHEGSFDFTVGEVVTMGRYAHKKMTETLGEDDKKACDDALKLVGLSHLYDRSYLSLSGGEKQRVLMARAFAQDTPMMILDEPTNHLDIGSQIKTLKLLKNSGKTILAALHDLSVAARFCDRIYIMQKGSIVADGNPDSVLSAELVKNLYDIDVSLFRHDEQLFVQYL